MAGKKSRAELEAEVRLLRGMKNMEGIFGVLSTLITNAARVGIAYIAYLSIAALAGEMTVANFGIAIEGFGKTKVSEALAWMFGAGGVFYGRVQDKLRRDTIQRISGRIKELESAIDRDRSSSKLDERGKTRPEDK